MSLAGISKGVLPAGRSISYNQPQILEKNKKKVDARSSNFEEFMYFCCSGYTFTLLMIAIRWKLRGQLDDYSEAKLS